MHGDRSGRASQSTPHAWVLQWAREPVDYRRRGLQWAREPVVYRRMGLQCPSEPVDYRRRGLQWPSEPVDYRRMGTAVAMRASRLPTHGYCSGQASRSTTDARVLQWPREPGLRDCIAIGGSYLSHHVYDDAVELGKT
ncbi:MAG: hypothetical protein M3O46_13735 [Myxococcota bacterium]|nr:hypothetical protein [Myxococcota bacterium]